MFFILLIISVTTFFYFKKKAPKEKGLKKSPFKKVGISKSKELSVDDQISEWTEKNKVKSTLAKKEITDIAPVSNIKGINFLVLCKSCLIVYSIEDSPLCCENCKSDHVVMSDKGKLFSGRWSKETNSWALTKESAHPIMAMHKNN